MSIFYCDACHRNEDGDEVGYVVLPDGREVCVAAADAIYDDDLNDERDDEPPMTLAQRRQEMGGEYGGDGADD